LNLKTGDYSKELSVYVKIILQWMLRETVCQGTLDWTFSSQEPGAGSNLSAEFLDLLSATITIQEGTTGNGCRTVCLNAYIHLPHYRRQNQKPTICLLISYSVTGITRTVAFCTLHRLW